MDDTDLSSEALAVRKMFDHVPVTEARPSSAFDELHGRDGVRVNGSEIRGSGGGTEQPTSEVQKTFAGIVMNNGILTHARVDGTLGDPVTG